MKYIGNETLSEIDRLRELKFDIKMELEFDLDFLYDTEFCITSSCLFNQSAFFHDDYGE